MGMGAWGRDRYKEKEKKAHHEISNAMEIFCKIMLHE